MVRTAELIDKYEGMTRAADRGAEDGRSNLPASDEDSYSPTEAEVIQIALADFNALTAGRRRANVEAFDKAHEHEVKVPGNLGFAIDDFENRAEFKIQEVDRALVRLYRIVIQRDQDYRFFKKFHRLKRDAAPEIPLSLAVAQLVLAIVLDGAFNAYFFKDATLLGPVGGYLIALVVSACNVAFGFLIGWGPVRFFTHRYRLHLLWALPIFAALCLGLVAFNFGLAHYRDMLIDNPAAEPTNVIDYISKHPFGMPSFLAALMAIVGLGIGLFSAIKGFSMLDSYPWFGWFYKKRLSAELDFEDRIEEIQEVVNAAGEAYIEDARKAYNSASGTILGAERVLDELAAGNREYYDVVKAIETAVNAVLRTYREANKQVRDMDRYPSPDYFEKRWEISGKLDQENQTIRVKKEGLTQLRTDLKKVLEKLEKEIPEKARSMLSEASVKARMNRIMEEARRLAKFKLPGGMS